MNARPAPIELDSLDAVVDWMLSRTTGDLRIGAPLGLGKPHRLLNAIYARAERDSSRRLYLYTALSLDPWRDLLDWFGPWQTAYTRFCHWRDDVVLDRIVQKLQVLLADAGKIDWGLWCVDGTSVRAARCAAGAKGGARKSPRITL